MCIVRTVMQTAKFGGIKIHNMWKFRETVIWIRCESVVTKNENHKILIDKFLQKADIISWLYGKTYIKIYIKKNFTSIGSQADKILQMSEK